MVRNPRGISGSGYAFEQITLFELLRHIKSEFDETLFPFQSYKVIIKFIYFIFNKVNKFFSYSISEN